MLGSDKTKKESAAPAENHHLNINEIPVHTMEQDLREIEHPGSTKGIDNLENFSPKNQEKSPFLAQNEELKSVAEKAEKPEKIEKKEGTSLGRAFMAATIIAIILVAAGGGYYFWTTRNIAIESTESEPESEEISEPVIEEPETPITEESPAPAIAKFNTDKPNYFQIDPSKDSLTIQSAIEDYGVKIAAEKITTPVEFVVTDENNNPINFKTFANQLGITFPEELMAEFSNDFSLFIAYNPAGNDFRTGLAIKIKSKPVQEAILIDETKLLEELKPLMIIDYSQPPIDPAFKKSSYRDAAIHYRNILPNDSLSVDYTFFDEKLIIGTTKMTLRSIIDYLITAKESADTIDIPWTAQSTDEVSATDIE